MVLILLNFNKTIFLGAAAPQNPFTFYLIVKTNMIFI